MLKEKKLLPPPWIAYPHIERYSIGWRMGYGEAYIDKWGEWYDSLNEREKKEYMELFPEPITWIGYWKDEHEYDDFVKTDLAKETSLSDEELEALSKITAENTTTETTPIDTTSNVNEKEVPDYLKEQYGLK